MLAFLILFFLLLGFIYSGGGRRRTTQRSPLSGSAGIPDVGLGCGAAIIVRRRGLMRKRNESFFTDDGALPLLMTHPNSSPVSAAEIDKRLNCDPEIQVINLFKSRPLKMFKLLLCYH